MIQKMSIEDRTLRTLRRAIGFSQVVKKVGNGVVQTVPIQWFINVKRNSLIKLISIYWFVYFFQDLLPLLINIKDDRQITDSTIK